MGAGLAHVPTNRPVSPRQLATALAEHAGTSNTQPNRYAQSLREVVVLPYRVFSVPCPPPSPESGPAVAVLDQHGMPAISGPQGDFPDIQREEGPLQPKSSCPKPS